MAQNGRARATLGYRAYRFPHRKGRLQRRWSRGSGVFGVFTVLISAVVAMGVLMGTLAITAFAFVSADLPKIEQLRTAPVPLATHIYDRTGQHLLYVLAEQRRELVRLEEVPEVMQQATVAMEDRTFWTNPGIDPAGMVRAAIENFQSGVITQGASTITQQLIKARLVGDERSFERKIREALLALEAARAYSKEEILEMYFNQIYYGNQAYGVKAAATSYFRLDDMSRMTLGQAALLAGLPQAPSQFDPVTNPEAAAARRQTVLQAMIEVGYITPDQAAAAAAEPIEVYPAETPIQYPHFVFRVREQLADALGSDRAAYTGGYRVLTTLDVELQNIAEEKVRERVEALSGFNVHNAALISLDPRNGQILAYVGSLDYYNDDPGVRGDFDVAGLGQRQMGSSFKLFTYLAALQRGYTPASILWDVSTNFGVFGSQAYRPQNAPHLNRPRGVEHGPLTIRQAIRESLNIPAVKVAGLVGVDAIIETVHQLGVNRDWDRSRIGLSFALGAGEMTLAEMAQAYQVMANMGVQQKPTMLLRVVGPDGGVVLDNSEREGAEIFSPQLAWLMTDILKDTTDPNGSPIFGSWTHIGRPAALKTGTTDNLNDVLAIGYVPQLLTAVWMGNSDNSEMRGISSAMGPGVLWREFMRAAIDHYELAPEWYERPEGIVERVICARPGLFGGSGSGLLPGGGCPASWRTSEFFLEGTEPTRNSSSFFGEGGCVIPRAERREWQADLVRWAEAGKNSTRLGLPICGISPPTPEPTASPDDDDEDNDNGNGRGRGRGGESSPSPSPSPP